MKKVVIVDDQHLFALGFKQLIDQIESVEVVAIYRSGIDIERKLYVDQPDILFLDLNLPKMNGLEILKKIRSSFPKMIIAVLTMYEDTTLINRVRQLNANAYLSKDATIEELQEVIFTSSEQVFYVNKKLQNITPQSSSLLDDNFVDLTQITNREKEIIRLIVAGKSSEEISRELFISFETVKTHRKNIFKKLKLNKVQDLIQFAQNHYLL